MVAAVALAVALAGCGDADAPPPAPRPTVPPGSGVISGTVTLAGPRPVMREIPNAACHPGGPAARDESVVADDAGRLANVVVYLKDGPPVDVPAADPAVLDQAGCRFVPHVVAVRTGQALRIRSSDPTPHNVHGMCAANAAFNFGLTAAGDAKDLSFARPETFRVKCDVHPWMTGYVAVFDHPLFAVTRGEASGGDAGAAAAGRFAIRRVPAGTYTLVAWHERLGTIERQVTIPPGDGPAAETSVELVYDRAK